MLVKRTRQFQFIVKTTRHKDEIVKPEKNSIFLKNGKTVILDENQKIL